ncbi:MAG: nucleotide exchange factor GrpE [Thermoleophilia bacterium]
MAHEKRKIPINNHDAESESTAPHETITDQEVGPETATGESRGTTPSPGTPPDGSLDGSAAIEAVAAERDGYLDGLMRLQAEFENFRRRSQRELNEARNRARMGILGEFLPVFDNLARSLDAAEHHEEGKVLEGVRLTHALFADLLRREGVSEIDPLGSPFDPHLHEAIVSVPSDVDEGVVIQVVEKGYTAGENVLRPARVAVSAGSPDPGSSPAGPKKE